MFLSDELQPASEPREDPVPVNPPPGSPVKVDRFDDGLTIEIPPAGIAGTLGLFLFAIIWDVFALLLLLIVLGNQNQKGSTGVLLLVLAIFWLVGIGLMLASLHMARRRAAIAVTGGTLMVIQTGLFGSKQRTWEPGDVEAVRLGHSGVTVNDKPVQELQIYDGGLVKFGMLAGRKDEELEWIAAELRAALKVPLYAE